MRKMLDPWDDGSMLADRLQLPGCRLLILLGAEAWCARCRDIRPDFESMAEKAPENEIWLWLDVEDHAEFLGKYHPDNLPMMFVYAGNCLESSTYINNALTLNRVSQGVSIAEEKDRFDPGIRSRLLVQDWSVK